MRPGSTSQELDARNQEIANRLLAEGPIQPDPRDLELFPNPQRYQPTWEDKLRAVAKRLQLDPEQTERFVQLRLRSQP